ncbi:hypothetical protein TBLA_0C06860 [Henningerozyma blattae CBS 6284]|uniref:Amidase domain-containing protein n=1 Tax=Henningerozyma blattae (strain ATCC 34711 / CBS 6284 / DSM 70876 / NBRC 10599 / NRRL Y-10934 / UCD 77-7) TaxID=1071380 RepID=I2H276_HENB6|nr:hypothetical protein TBLA_0C06860 [Tetrapisispora blattae CBS 6284]CCH60478.1 hypothetical protein TBLA_0C06860 [Tetrapisispora blattae CBS 6284]
MPLNNNAYNAFISLAKNTDNLISKTPLITVAIKDNIATKQLPTTCASKILSNYTSPFEATVVRQLIDAKRYSLVGTTNMDEFAMGSTGLHSIYGPTINPLLEDRVPGGSSSGSAASVSSTEAMLSLGTDTGGSVRLPAAYTSTLGFKPSYGRLSRHGVVAFAQSLDTVGLFATDINILKQAFMDLDKYDPKDPTSMADIYREKLNKSNKKRDPNQPIKIGIPVNLCSGLSSTVKDAFINWINTNLLSNTKIKVEIYPLYMEILNMCLPVYYTLAPSEAVSNLARFDGIRFGSRKSTLEATRSLFGDEVKDRLILGNYNLCQDSFHDTYMKALKLRVQIIDEFDSIFTMQNVYTDSKGNSDGLDYIISPTNSDLPSKVADTKKGNNNVKEYIADILTVPASLAGLPALNIPSANKGIGIHLLGQFGDDHGILNFANSVY